MESVRVLLRNLNVFVSETRNSLFTRIDVLKAQMLYDEVWIYEITKLDVSVLLYKMLYKKFNALL